MSGSSVSLRPRLVTTVLYSTYSSSQLHRLHSTVRPSQKLAWRITRALINQGPSSTCRRIPNFCLLIRCPRRQIARSEPFSRFAWLLALHPPSLRDRLGGPVLDNSSGSGFVLCSGNTLTLCRRSTEFEVHITSWPLASPADLATARNPPF